MNPGEHLIVIGSEIDTFQYRAQGLSLRDTVIILMPGVRALSAFLFRAPLEGTVADNILKHGVGALNIDGCRVGTGKNKGIWPITDRKGRTSLNSANDGSLNNPVETDSTKGRWPTNLLLVHGPRCRDVGSKEAWNCQPDCPVKLLDDMSGELPAGVAVQRNRDGQVHNKVYSPRRYPPDDDVTYGGSGGASRFFPQFPDLRSALDWLQRLVS